MPKPSKFPTLYNEALKIHISQLKGWGYLDPKQIKSGALKWISNGHQTGSISIQANTLSENPYIELDYSYKEEPHNYKVYLTSTPSNLNKGKVWYFLCPQTNKRCRKLYLIDGYFLHREAFNGCMYEIQTQSKKSRLLEKTFGAYFNLDQYYEQLYKKHFKKNYAGKPTKKYLKLIRKIEKAENIDCQTIELLSIVR